jgi:hypothetical protein
VNFSHILKFEILGCASISSAQRRPKDPDGGWKSHHSQQASTLDEEGACGQRVLTKEEPATKEKSRRRGDWMEKCEE